MGEIAEDMLDGACCELCGQYFENTEEPEYMYEHGYPVVCWDCWPTLNKEEKKHHQKSLMPNL